MLNSFVEVVYVCKYTTEKNNGFALDTLKRLLVVKTN